MAYQNFSSNNCVCYLVSYHRHFLRTVLFWDNTCIYDYHNYVRMKTKGNFKISSTICLHLPMLQMQSIVSSLNESYTLVCTTSY